MAVGYYVTLRRGGRTAWLAGPFDTKAEAEAMVPRAVDEAARVDPFTHFDPHGTARVEAKQLPRGKLNARLGLMRQRPHGAHRAVSTKVTRSAAARKGWATRRRHERGR